MKVQWQQALSFFQVYWRGGAVLAGLLSYLLLSGGATFLGFFLALWTFFPLCVSLWKWGEEGFLIASATALSALFMTYTATEVVAYALLYVIPLFLYGRLLLYFSRHGLRPSRNKEKPLGVLPETLLLYFLISMGICYTLFSFWILSSDLQAMMELPAIKALLQEIPEESLREKILGLTPYLPAGWGLMWGLIFGVNILGSRWVFCLLEAKQNFTWRHFHFSLRTWHYWVFILTLLGCLMEGVSTSLALLSRNLVFFTLLPFMVEGFLILHGCLKHFIGLKRGAGLLLSGLVFLGWPLLIVVVLGLFEPWNHLRKRLGLQYEGEN